MPNKTFDHEENYLSTIRPYYGLHFCISLNKIYIMISIIYLKEDLPQLSQAIDKGIQGENFSNQERIMEK